MKIERSDRTVHAKYQGMEIVRYDRAGKWYLEPTDNPHLKRQPCSLADAAKAALWGWENAGGAIYEGRPGGKRFDAKVRNRV